MKKATYLIISGDKRHNDFMQACDVFEQSKFLGDIYTFEITFNEKDDNVTLKKAGDNIKHIKASLEQKEVGHIVSLIHLVSIQIDNKIILNDKKIWPYFNMKVKTISNGKKWFVFHTFIKERCGYDFKINNDYTFKENTRIKNELLIEKTIN